MSTEGPNLGNSPDDPGIHPDGFDDEFDTLDNNLRIDQTNRDAASWPGSADRDSIVLPDISGAQTYGELIGLGRLAGVDVGSWTGLRQPEIRASIIEAWGDSPPDQTTVDHILGIDREADRGSTSSGRSSSTRAEASSSSQIDTLISGGDSVDTLEVPPEDLRWAPPAVQKREAVRRADQAARAASTISFRENISALSPDEQVVVAMTDPKLVDPSNLSVEAIIDIASRLGSDFSGLSAYAARANYPTLVNASTVEDRQQLGRNIQYALELARKSNERNRILAEGVDQAKKYEYIPEAEQPAVLESILGVPIDVVPQDERAALLASFRTITNHELSVLRTRLLAAQDQIEAARAAEPTAEDLIVSAHQEAAREKLTDLSGKSVHGIAYRAIQAGISPTNDDGSVRSDNELTTLYRAQLIADENENPEIILERVANKQYRKENYQSILFDDTKSMTELNRRHQIEVLVNDPGEVKRLLEQSARNGADHTREQVIREYQLRLIRYGYEDANISGPDPEVGVKSRADLAKLFLEDHDLNDVESDDLILRDLVVQDSIDQIAEFIEVPIQDNEDNWIATIDIVAAIKDKIDLLDNPQRTVVPPAAENNAEQDTTPESDDLPDISSLSARWQQLKNKTTGYYVNTKNIIDEKLGNLDDSVEEIYRQHQEAQDRSLDGLDEETMKELVKARRTRRIGTAAIFFGIVGLDWIKNK